VLDVGPSANAGTAIASSAPIAKISFLIISPVGATPSQSTTTRKTTSSRLTSGIAIYNTALLKKL
jgi:hypothetical protein